MIVNQEARKMNRYLNRIILFVIGAVVLYFWLTPVSQRNVYLEWGGLLLFAICVIVLSLRFSMLLRRWRGFGALLGAHIAAQLWLQWQWRLWDSPIVLIRNLNTIATLAMFGTLLAMLISLVLLLIYRDASAIALAAAWIGFPILIIVTGWRYTTFEQFSNVGFRENIILMTPTCLLCFMGMAGLFAFFAHYGLLVIEEISGRGIGGA